MSSNKCFQEPGFYNEPLFQSSNFKVIPSLGSLVEGWLLIIPNSTYISIGEMDYQLKNELFELQKEVEEVLRSEYGSVVTFEHGPRDQSLTVGCGVDYAHLHLIPINYDLINGVQKFLGLNFDWKVIDDLRDVTLSKKDLSYLYYKNQQGSSFITYKSNFQSQLFRKVVAHYLNISFEFDWKKYPKFENIQMTINHLRRYSLVDVKNQFSYGE